MIKKIIKKFLGKNKQNPILSEGMLLRYPNLTWQEFEALKNLATIVLERSGGRVFHGPLAGLKIPNNCYLATKATYAVGSYELETHEPLYNIIANPPEKFIDIGSAYGYYTVGIALQTLKTKIIGFEGNEKLWEESAKLADLNGVSSRIDQKGLCQVTDLNQVIGNNDVILCDCEGGEIELLNPVHVPALKHTRILCEMHDFFAQNATAIIVDRFSSTHDIKIFDEVLRNPMHFRILDGLTAIEKFLCVRETRYTQGKLTPARYLYMVPKENGDY